MVYSVVVMRLALSCVVFAVCAYACAGDDPLQPQTVDAGSSPKPPSTDDASPGVFPSDASGDAATQHDASDSGIVPDASDAAAPCAPSSTPYVSCADSAQCRGVTGACCLVGEARQCASPSTVGCDLLCASAAGCSSDMKCCASVGSTITQGAPGCARLGSVNTASCKDSCPGNELELCASNDECAAEHVCVGFDATQYGAADDALPYRLGTCVPVP